ncbi:GNAT family N-acetyltransferase [[Actinomadura] parvosata]|uniref:GNAT family N-acetyltransferase n=1 Tax=[Actinomadura] parvosata TaxID=1955412 RepID=UPI00406C8251
MRGTWGGCSASTTPPSTSGRGTARRWRPASSTAPCCASPPHRTSARPRSTRSPPTPATCWSRATTAATACPSPGGSPTRRSPGSSCRGRRGRCRAAPSPSTRPAPPTGCWCSARPSRAPRSRSGAGTRCAAHRRPGWPWRCWYARPGGEPAAAATGWFAGPGRCGLLEPVGTHPDHRGHGYGREAVLGTCAALTERGASAVAVATPSANEAAVALYRSAGFTVVRETRDWARPQPH